MFDSIDERHTQHTTGVTKLSHLTLLAHLLLVVWEHNESVPLALHICPVSSRLVDFFMAVTITAKFVLDPPLG
jgi:hypothetical protein